MNTARFYPRKIRINVKKVARPRTFQPPPLSPPPLSPPPLSPPPYLADIARHRKLQLEPYYDTPAVTESRRPKLVARRHCWRRPPLLAPTIVAAVVAATQSVGVALRYPAAIVQHRKPSLAACHNRPTLSQSPDLVPFNRRHCRRRHTSPLSPDIENCRSKLNTVAYSSPWMSLRILVSQQISIHYYTSYYRPRSFPLGDHRSC
jgi:hypothetical protein